MTTFSALTTLASREDAEALGEALEGFLPEPVGIGVFEIEDGSGRFEVGAYFDARPDDTELALLAAIYGAAPFAVSEVPETDWVAQVRRELHPVDAGRFFLHGGHDAARVPPGRVPLLIEAAMAFGTGHHGTTRGCLLALDRLDREHGACASVADIGCGTAVLAIAAAKIWPQARIVAADIDAVAVEVAMANTEVNAVAGRVSCVTAPGFAHPLLERFGPYDLVFANILKQPLIELAPGMARHVAPGGAAILSGILNEQAAEVIVAYAGQFTVEHRDEIGEWTTLVLRRAQ